MKETKQTHIIDNDGEKINNIFLNSNLSEVFFLLILCLIALEENKK